MPRSHPTDSDLTGLGWGLGFGLLFKNSSYNVILEPGWRRKYRCPNQCFSKPLSRTCTAWQPREMQILIQTVLGWSQSMCVSHKPSTDAEETDPWIKLRVAGSKALRCSVLGREWLAGHILASCSKEICYLQAGPSERQTSKLVFKDRTRPRLLYAFDVEPEAKHHDPVLWAERSIRGKEKLELQRNSDSVF